MVEMNKRSVTDQCTYHHRCSVLPKVSLIYLPLHKKMMNNVLILFIGLDKRVNLLSYYHRRPNSKPPASRMPRTFRSHVKLFLPSLIMTTLLFIKVQIHACFLIDQNAKSPVYDYLDHLNNPCA